MIRSRLCWLLLPAVLTACGTTVPLTSQQQGGAQGGSGIGTTAGGFAPDGSTPVGGLPGVPGSSAGSVTDALPSSGSVVTGGTRTTSGSAGASGLAAVAPGTRNTKPLTIGIVTIDYSELARQFGAELPTTFYTAFENLIKAINVRGGLNGRQVKAVYHTQNGAAADYGTEAQRTCAVFTQDNKVDVVLSYITAQPVLAQCLKAKGVMQIDNQQFAMTDGQLKTFDNYVNIAGISLERTAKAVIGGAAEAGVVTNKSVLGILMSACRAEDSTANTLLPQLAKRYRLGLVIERVKCFTGVSDLGSVTSQIQSAVLKFRQSGVTDVFALTGSEGFVVTAFAKSADSQQYYPDYLVSSNLFPWSNSGGGEVPRTALEKMRGFGWTPYLDTGDKTVKTASSAAQAACTALDKTQGEAKAIDPRLYWNAVHFFYAECDQLLLLGKMLQLTGGQTSLSVLRSAYERAAGSFASASAYDGRLLGRSDAPATMQRIAWTGSCECFLPVGGRVPAPQ